ncbi:MAG TPA: hypothetical protein VMD75_03990 [Candidatus Binataceae bacterium]|nr:hypothetical protein [Candidatus Binataceae bacterium]
MSPSKEFDPDDLKLREAGFNPDAAPETALQTLSTLRGQPGMSDLAIARALGSLKSIGAADLLAAMEHAASGPLRREIRRSLFRLHQSGISPSPGAEPYPHGASRPLPAAGAEVEGMLSPIDATGVRLVWIMKPKPRGGLNLLWGFASEEDGLIGCNFGPVSRRELRTDRARVEERAGVKMIEADWRLCDLILHEAYRATPEGRRGAVGNFFAWRAELIASSPPGDDFVHPVYAELAVEAAGEPGIELLKEPEVLAWKFSAAELKPYVDEIAEVQQSVIVLNQIQQEDRIGRVIEKAIEGFFTGPAARRARRRLEDIAYYLAHTGRRRTGGYAAAAAAKIRDGADLKRIPFFQNLLRTMLGAVIAEQQEKDREQPRLIMTPAEAMRAQAQRQSRQG